MGNPYIGGHAQFEYIIILKRLLRNAMAEERYEEARKIFAFIEQTRIVKNDPLFMFKV